MTTEDPIILYLVIRESLNMSPGKIGAQCGHAVEKFLDKYYNKLMSKIVESEVRQEPLFLDERMLLVEAWKKQGHTKVVLAADDKEWEKVREELRDTAYVVCDAGHTELAPGTDTVLTFWPVKKSMRPKIIKRLQLL
jgi:peptidyl-tRNA hydrolase, PTH2 family